MRRRSPIFVIIALAFALDPCVFVDARADAVHAEGKPDTLSSSDKAFLRASNMAALFEIELGRRVSPKTRREEVRKLADRLASDRTREDDLLVDLAKRKGLLDLPKILDEDHRRRIDDIAVLEGGALDRKYVSVVLAEARRDADAFEHEAKTTTDDDVRAFAAAAQKTATDEVKAIAAIDAKLMETSGAKPK